MRRVLGLVVACLVAASAKKQDWDFDSTSEHTWTGKNDNGVWVFIGKFCFYGTEELEEGERLSGEIDLEVWQEHDKKDDDVTLKIFRDDNHGDEWVVEYDQTITREYYRVQAPVSSKIRYFWYFYLYRPGDKHIKGQAKIHMVQSDGSEFSADESGILSMHIGGLVLFTLTLVFHIAQARELHRLACYNDTFKLYSCIQGFMFVSFLFAVIHYAQYYKDGYGLAFFRGMGQILYSCTNMLFLSVIMLVAKGWEITRPLTGVTEFGIIIACVILTHMLIGVWMVAAKDPATNKYYLNTPPGQVLILENAGLFCWFCYQVYTTYKSCKPMSFKRRFFMVFGCVYMWYFLLPAFVGIIAPHVDDAYRLVSMTGIEIFCNMVWVTIFSFFFWPIWVTDLYDQNETFNKIGNDLQQDETATVGGGGDGNYGGGEVDTSYSRNNDLTDGLDNL